MKVVVLVFLIHHDMAVVQHGSVWTELWPPGVKIIYAVSLMKFINFNYIN
jgi:hypothetical protein